MGIDLETDLRGELLEGTARFCVGRRGHLGRSDAPDALCWGDDACNVEADRLMSFGPEN